MIYSHNLTVMYIDWATLKTKIATVNSPFQYEETSDLYEIFIIDEVVVYAHQIFKGTVPENGSITQQDNDDNKQDFLDNYEPTANKPFSTWPKYVSQKNDEQLKPFGRLHKHLDSSTKISDVTLSDKTGSDFTSTGSPAVYDYLTQNHCANSGLITAVDGTTVTAFYPDDGNGLANGAAKLLKPWVVDLKLVDDASANIDNVWGCYLTAKDFGEDDFMRSIIIDKDGIGVALGWYTQQEFDAMGEYVVKEYDECWINQADKIVLIDGPDKKPGELPMGLYLRMHYYCTDATKTDIKLWLDYRITVRDV